MKYLILPILFFSLLLASCNKDHCELNTVNFQIGEEAVICMRQSAILEPDGIEIKLINIPTDTRCPEEVICILPSFVNAELLISDGQTSILDTVFFSNVPFDLFGHSLMLQEVLPIPRLGEPFETEDYAIKILVE